MLVKYEKLFQVMAANVPYGSAGVTCTKVIKVKVGGTEIRLMAGMNTTINGVQMMQRTLQKRQGDLHQGHQNEGRWDGDPPDGWNVHHNQRGPDDATYLAEAPG